MDLMPTLAELGERREVTERLHSGYLELLRRIGTPEGRLKLRERLP